MSRGHLGPSSTTASFTGFMQETVLVLGESCVARPYQLRALPSGQLLAAMSQTAHLAIRYLVLTQRTFREGPTTVSAHLPVLGPVFKVCSQV